ncbi:hypothetical protein CAP35_04710 [Chitinophagaceae bacterium IBVUCB1]|nr:hypothetical protein CAP35_04710 [Chitinophagaceae bacterium IBVUCB1]
MEEVKIVNPIVEDSRIQIITLGNPAMMQINSIDDAYDYFKVNWTIADMLYEKKMFIAVVDSNNLVLKHYILPDYLDFYSNPKPIIKYIGDQEKTGTTKDIKIYLAENDTFGEFTYGQHNLSFIENIKLICQNVNISFVDQLIISTTGYFSFKNNKLC